MFAVGCLAPHRPMTPILNEPHLLGLDAYYVPTTPSRSFPPDCANFTHSSYQMEEDVKVWKCAGQDSGEGTMPINTILVVDDDPRTIEVIRLRLERDGFRVLAAVNGQLALDAIRVGQPDLVVLDLTMPVLDGL